MIAKVRCAIQLDIQQYAFWRRQTHKWLILRKAAAQRPLNGNLSLKPPQTQCSSRPRNLPEKGQLHMSSSQHMAPDTVGTTASL